MDLVGYLTRRKVPFERVEWRAAPRSLEKTDSVHLRGKHVARTMLLRTLDGYVIAILPWAYSLDMEALEDLLGTRPIVIASREEIGQVFPDCSADHVPPFGSSFGIRTVMDIHLAGCVSILFKNNEADAGLRMELADFRNLEHPITGNFAIPPNDN